MEINFFIKTSCLGLIVNLPFSLDIVIFGHHSVFKKNIEFDGDHHY